MCSSTRLYRNSAPSASQVKIWPHALTLVKHCSAKQAHSRQCVTADTPMEMCSSYTCAVTQPQCTAARFRAKYSPHCSVLLCKQAHSRQSVTANTPMELLSSYRCEVTQSPLFTAALQNRLTSRHCVTAFEPMEMFSSHRCAVTQHQCTAARFRAKHSPHCSVLLCTTGSHQAECPCKYTYGDLLLIQVCSDAAQCNAAKFRA